MSRPRAGPAVMTPPRTALPEIELTTLQGEAVALRDPSAAARLVVLYRHDCEPCRQVLPVIERVTRAFHGQRLLTLGVSQSDGDGTLDTIIEHGLCFPQALDADLAVSAALQVSVLPTLVLADGAGTIVARCDGRDRDALLDLLLVAARIAGADEAEIRRAVDAFALPAERAGGAARSAGG
jgi:peroxiredoxin